MRIKFSSKLTELASRGIYETQAVEADATIARERRNDAVRRAIESLSDREQSIVRRHHFEGISFRQIADDLGVEMQSVMNCHNRALRRLRKQLMPLVEAEFGMTGPETACVICSSPHRRQIEEILGAHVRGEPYRETMRDLRRRFNVEIVSVMTIVGHCKYHS